MKANNFLKQMRGDSMFFKKKPKYLVFDNKTDFITIRIKQIVYIKTNNLNNDYFFEIHLINGSSLQFDCRSKEVRDKICEAIRNILI